MTKKTIIYIGACIFVIGIIIYWIITGVDSKRLEWIEEIPQTSCLQPEVTTVPSIIPQEKPFFLENYYQAMASYFPHWWKPMLKKDQLKQLSKTSIDYFVIDGKDIWLLSDQDPPYKYDTQTKQLIAYKTTADQNIDEWIQIDDIYRAKNGVMWTTGTNNDGNLSFARYRPDIDKFIIIRDKYELFKSIGRDKSNFGGQRMDELSDGQLIVLLNGNIYKYNPDTNAARLIYGDGFALSIHVDIKDNIWFVDILNGYNVIRLNGISGGYLSYGAPPQLINSFENKSDLEKELQAITIDLDGRIWLSYFDRLEPDGKGGYRWKSLILPSVMVATYSPIYAYSWANVRSSLVSSNGDIWFLTYGTIVKYDTNADNWCLSAVSVFSSNYAIAQDSEGNIWTEEHDQLFKLDK
jgi:hypothetical protein